MNVFVFNCGSSSVKAQVVDPQAGVSVLGGRVERIGEAGARLTTGQRLTTGTRDESSGAVAVAGIQRIQSAARKDGVMERPRWPMIILRSPKGWTGPKAVDGKPTEDSWRSHQVPMGDMDQPSHVRILERWLKSYQPETLFDQTGRLKAELAALAPEGERRMSANPHANGGLLLRDLRLPDFRDYSVNVSRPGSVNAEATRVMGQFLRDVMKQNLASRNFRLFSPDENNSNRWQDVLEVTQRAWMARNNSSATNSSNTATLSASMARTCRRCETGSGVPNGGEPENESDRVSSQQSVRSIFLREKRRSECPVASA
jgi:hypothetical protein